MITAHKNEKGFTLLELLIVVAIIVIITTGVSLGLTYLQNMVALDTTLRTVKVEIQSAQNEARNSFIASNSLNENTLGAEKISLGWIAEVKQVSMQSIQVVKRSVYFLPGTGYPYGNLNSDIAKVKSDLSFGGLANYQCDSSNNLVSVIKGQIKAGINNVPVTCSTGTCGSPGTDYACSTVFNQIQFSPPPPTAVPECGYSNSSFSIFFTAGYGEPVVNNNSCEIRIKSTGTMSGYRALLVESKTGTVVTCGNYC